MKKSKEIDEYFKVEVSPVEEPKERRASIRRVSFAPEPQIVYHNIKEEQSKSESSSISMSMEAQNKTSIEMTIEEQMEESMQEHESLPICEEREENFIMEDSEDSMEDKRMSVCPAEYQRTMEHSMCITAEIAEHTKDSPSDTSQQINMHEHTFTQLQSTSVGGVVHTPVLHTPSTVTTHSTTPLHSLVPSTVTTHTSRHSISSIPPHSTHPTPPVVSTSKDECAIEDAENKDDIISDMLSEIICASENNTLVYDTVNVEEVLSKYESSKQQGAKKIRDILSESGIRFLDNLNLTNRRDTLSKIRNKVDKEQIVYYSEYLQKRIEMQNTFSSALSLEIEKTRSETESLEREVDCAGLSQMERSTLSSKLRQIKSDARREGKMHWHLKRLEKEEVFLEETKKRYHTLENTLQQLKQELQQKSLAVQQISITALEEKERHIKETVQKIGTMNEENVAKFMQEVEQNAEHLLALQREYDTLVRKESEEASKEKQLDQLALEEQNKAEALQESLLAAEVQKDDLDQAKETVQRMEVVFGVCITEVSHSRLLFTLSDISVTVIYDGSNIVDVYAEAKTKGLFSTFIAQSVGAIPGVIDKITQGFPLIIRYILEMCSVEKEIARLGVSVPYEMSSTEKELAVQFMIRKGKTGRLGTVQVVFLPGVVHPKITSNIKGFQAEHTRYGCISQSVSTAKAIARIK